MKYSLVLNQRRHCQRRDWGVKGVLIFVVHNLTSRTIILSDLRAEVGPRKLLDLEKVANREDIDRSRDLKQALNSKKLALTRHSVVHANVNAKQPEITRVIEKTIEKTVSTPAFDEERLSALIKKAVEEQMQAQKTERIEDSVSKAVSKSLGGLVASIRDQINSVQVSNTQSKRDMTPEIDPAKLAEISQKSVQKMSENIETGGSQKSRKINVVNKNLNNLADELG